MQVKGLRRDVVKRLVEERTARGLFRSFHDLLSRVRTELAQVRLLIKTECCDTIAGELTRPALVWRALAVHNRHNSQVASLSNAARAGHGPLPIPEEYSEERQLQDEIACLGFPLRSHPLDLYRQAMEQRRPIAARDLNQYIGHRVILAGWLLT
jgi:DNA polymerase III alpha subunit